MKRAAWFALGTFIGWMVGGLLLAAETKDQAPVDGLAGLEAAARESCLKRGLSLRGITVVYGTAGKVVSAQIGCGDPRRTSA